MTPLPKEIQQDLKRSLTTANWALFKEIRYSFGQEGEVFLIENLDLSGVDLSQLPSDFLCFKNCNLRGASFKGRHFWPTALWSCEASGLNIEGSYGMLFAFQSDLRGVKYNNKTNLFPSDNTDQPSAFEQCKLDEAFEEFARSQGAMMHFPKEKHIPAYAFGVAVRSGKDFITGKLS